MISRQAALNVIRYRLNQGNTEDEIRRVPALQPYGEEINDLIEEARGMEEESEEAIIKPLQHSEPIQRVNKRVGRKPLPESKRMSISVRLRMDKAMYELVKDNPSEKIRKAIKKVYGTEKTLEQFH